MSISGVGLSPSAVSTHWRQSVRQARQDFDQLVTSLQNGNLSDAQQAYGDFQKVQASLANPASTPTAATATSAATNPVLSDWSTLGQALQSGDLSSAQGALGQLQTDAQSAWQSHLQQQMQNAQSVYALMQQGTQGTPAASGQTGAGGLQNDLGALSQALQSGDTASAQKLLAQLEQDLQASASQLAGGHRHHHHRPDIDTPSSATSTTAATGTASVATDAATAATTGATATG